MSAAPEYTFRDAHLHSRLLRGLNVAGGALRRLGVDWPSLEPASILREARRRAGCHDLGEDSVAEPLAVLCDSLERESRLTPFGRLALRGMLVGALENRLRLVDWAKRHRSVHEERIRRPWVIVGLPRTGTTLLSILLGLDPAARPLEQWEAGSPVPPPDLATWREDPRIAASARQLERLAALNPPIRAMHPMGATLATECVTLFLFDLRSLAVETQAFVPGFGRWIDDADMGSAFRIHRLTLQVLQSRLPTEAWSLKTPQHLWCLETLLAHYPDARILWTHRDPRKVVPSVASLNCAMQRAFSDAVDPLQVGPHWRDRLQLAVTRGVDFDAKRQAAGDTDWCRHLQYADLMKDPVEAVRSAYAHFGDELHPLHEARMRAWMRDRPQDAHGRHRYRTADFGFDDAEIDERFAAYTQRFGIPKEG